MGVVANQINIVSGESGSALRRLLDSIRTKLKDKGASKVEALVNAETPTAAMIITEWKDVDVARTVAPEVSHLLDSTCESISVVGSPTILTRKL